MARITLANADVSFPCGPDETIMRAALRQGLGFPYECNVGSCGNCRFELLEGEIELAWPEAPAITERDRQRRRFLGCQAKPLTDCRIKVNLRDHYRSAHLPKRTEAALVAIADVTHDIREFRFGLAEPTPFRPGQYALLSIPGVTGARAYSMCNVSDDGAEWHFQIKRVAQGSATERLFASLSLSEVIPVDGPYGMAYLREEVERDILCLAGGSGLSPMISIARGAARSPKLADRALHFVYGGREARDICGEPMLRDLPGFGERIHYHPAVSTAGEAWTGHVGFVPDVARDLFGERLPEFEVYFAGPPAMAEAVMRMLVDAKVPPAQVHYDQFY